MDDAVGQYDEDHRIMRSLRRLQRCSEQLPDQQSGLQRGEQRKAGEVDQQRVQRSLAQPLDQPVQPDAPRTEQHATHQHRPAVEPLLGYLPLRCDRPQIEPAEHQRQIERPVGQQGDAHAPQAGAIEGA